MSINRRMLTLAVVLCSVAQPLAVAERVRMIGPSSGEETARQLMDSIAKACENHDLAGFMNHFTPARTAMIQEPMRVLFAKTEIEMDIQEITVVSEKANRVVFRLRYGWQTNTPKQTFVSEVAATKSKDGWKIHDEKVQQVLAPTFSEHFDFHGAGQVVLNPQDEDFWLPRDIARGDGGCVGGQCGVRR